MTQHKPVMLKEAIEHLNIRSNKNYIDATFGGGGYTREILKRNAPAGKVLAIDLNAQALVRGKEKDGDAPEAGAGTPLDTLDKDRTGQVPEPPTVSGFGGALDQDRLILAQGNFANIAEIVRSHNIKDVTGVVFDLGLSTDLLERSGRGFSFQQDEPLVMTYGSPMEPRHSTGQGPPGSKQAGNPPGLGNFPKKKEEPRGMRSLRERKGILTARDVVNNYSRDELEKIFKEYGEIRQARNITEGIAEYRKHKRIQTTFDLKEAVKGVNPVRDRSPQGGRGRTSGRAASNGVKSATPKLLAQVWQALRIEVNDELKNLHKGLAGAWQILDSGGRIVVVSFHSLEDRIVKKFFREKSRKKESGKTLTKKPVRPSKEEVERNTRARSARLRCAEKL